MNPVAWPLRFAKGDGAAEEAAPPKLSFGAPVAAAEAKGDREVVGPEANTLGFPEEPRVPKGEAVEEASLANADFAKAEGSVFSVGADEGFSEPDRLDPGGESEP